MRFLIDAQLLPSLAATLRECGQDAAHVFDFLPLDVRER
jgi:predicted nuclease of predicted toxin-antitoxin system